MSTGARIAPKPLAAALGTALMFLLVAFASAAGPAAAANAGGTASPSSPATSSKPGSAASKAGRPAATREASSPHDKAVRIMTVSCIPESKCSGSPHQVSTHGTLLIIGHGLAPGMTLAFPAKPGARISAASPWAHLRRSSSGLVATVPASAHSGHIKVLLPHGRYSSSYGPIYVFRHALHPPPKPVPVLAAVGAVAASGSPFEAQGMWIWYLSRSDGGDVAAIVAQAHAAGVSTLFIKSSDGSTNYWSQFSPQLVAELHANGLKACAWQYVYGTDPSAEAELGAEAVADGADCLVIDAEAEYEGHYAAAQIYINDLRARIGPAYPLGLASFPYVYEHPSFPYSVFLGPDGAQYNVPQMYWKDIGQSVDTVYANTYIVNRIYGRPIFPLGQTFGSISSAELLRFREEAVDYASNGVSFWDWQEASQSDWATLASPLAPLSTVTPNGGYPELGVKSKGDEVLWMQEHLASAIPAQEVTGVFSEQTAANLEAFQSAHAIAPTATTTPPTWAALLALPPVAVDWTGGGPSD